MNRHEEHQAYWHKSLIIVAVLLSIWFGISFGAGIFLKDWLDQFTIGNAPLGFWMAQQGSIIGFVIILVTYAILMNRLDKQFGYDEENDS